MKNFHTRLFFPLVAVNVCLLILTSISSLTEHTPTSTYSPPTIKTVEVSRTLLRHCRRRTWEEVTESGLIKSQSGEDAVLFQYFNGLCGGSYLEVGALNGVRFSNSYMLNKVFAWKGVLVESGFKNFESLTKQRPNELALVHAVVCNDENIVHYYEPDNKGAVGGIWEFADESFRSRWWPGIAIENTREVKCERLSEILRNHVGEPFYFDFFSLDIEGAEMDAIASLDFSKVSFGLITVEAKNRDESKTLAILKNLERNGYVFFREDERNYWFKNKDFDRIYSKLIKITR